MPGLFPDLLESPGINAGQQINSGKKGEGGIAHSISRRKSGFPEVSRR